MTGESGVPATPAAGTTTASTTSAPTSTTVPPVAPPEAAPAAAEGVAASPPATDAVASPSVNPCDDVVFTPHSEDMASEIVGTGVGCDVATALVTEVAAVHNVSSGPRSFTVEPFVCTVVTDEEGLLVGTYTCEGPDGTVAWEKT